MRPKTVIALQHLSMMCGMFVCFGIAMALYSYFKVNLPMLPLWVNLAALVGPVLLGMVLGHWLLCRVPLVCPTCRGRVERRRVEPAAWWKTPIQQYWCEACQHDWLGNARAGKERSVAAIHDTNW